MRKGHKRLRKWAQRYQEWVKSQQSQQRYCNEQKLSLNEIKWRTGEARKAGLIIKANKEAVENEGVTNRSPFVATRVIEREAELEIGEEEPYCELIFSGKHRVMIDSQESLMGLQELIQGLIKS